MTITLSATETSTYTGSARQELLAWARQCAWRKDRRFVQLVAADGRILDVIEIDLHKSAA